MAAASYTSGLFDHAAFNVLQLSDIPGAPDAPAVPLTGPHFVPGDARPPVIHQLLGALIDVPPSAWLFV
jgi:hypothetical protein